MTDELPEYIGELPNICGREDLIERTVEQSAGQSVFRDRNTIDFGNIRAAAAIALHMHQPLIPAGGGDLQTAAIISNLQYMMENQGIGDNHNAPVFLWCYKRMGEFIPELVNAGKEPRVMLEYSGTLFHGLRKMGANDVFDALRTITCNPEFARCVEWLGMPWGHPVAPSTPVQDYRLHVRAFQHHFAAIFGLEALGRIRGFSPSEMALPNHPDVAYAFVKTLVDCGYKWVLVQEHTVEQPENGHGPEAKHLPHRLVCRNSEGETAEIIAIIKTQGSDTKLVAQMQPWYEAQSLQRWKLAGKSVPPLVTQIADGENGGVMMNEFPPKFKEVVHAASHTDVPLMNVTEYLEHLESLGITSADFPVIQPILQKRIWDRFEPGGGPEKLAAVIEELRREDDRFHMDGGSWTNDISWVRGYGDVLGPMEEASSKFHEKVSKAGIPTDDPRYRNALFHLLCSQTSCYRYWGQGIWTDYGREICRRAIAIIENDF
ncbi:MAG: glycosyl hydrolase family 57 [Verrucomicrobia bacterium]|nr:MAG: glycosyl hydrolase family 57 [Verrucomicrobiota bacterium]